MTYTNQSLLAIGGSNRKGKRVPVAGIHFGAECYDSDLNLSMGSFMTGINLDGGSFMTGIICDLNLCMGSFVTGINLDGDNF